MISNDWVISTVNVSVVLFAATWTCPIGYTMCYGSRQCVLAWFSNDGENDCNVGTDEFAEYLGTTIVVTQLHSLYGIAETNTQFNKQTSSGAK